jgi:activator of HSP90 ATPase
LAKTIKQRTLIRASPKQVYDAYTNARTHAEVTKAPATGTRRVGATFTAYDGYIKGVHRVLTPGRRVVQDWTTTEWPEGAPASKVEFTFKAVKGGTDLRMVHSQVPASQADSYRQGWIDYYWTPLTEYFSKKGRTR